MGVAHGKGRSLGQEFEPVSLHSDSLLDLITRFRIHTGLSEFELWRMARNGLSSYWKQGGQLTGLSKDDAVVLKRAANQEKGWYLNSEFVPMSDWLRRFEAWQL